MSCSRTLMDRWTGGAGDQSTIPTTNGQPRLSPELVRCSLVDLVPFLSYVSCLVVER